VPDIEQRPDGCAFANRCSYRTEVCAQLPPLQEVETAHRSACFHADLLTADVAGATQ
jgi:oligopeptide/dipeptide ABC transporter ATP-binding protein